MSQPAYYPHQHGTSGPVMCKYNDQCTHYHLYWHHYVWRNCGCRMYFDVSKINENANHLQRYDHTAQESDSIHRGYLQYSASHSAPVQQAPVQQAPMQQAPVQQAPMQHDQPINSHHSYTKPRNPHRLQKAHMQTPHMQTPHMQTPHIQSVPAAYPPTHLPRRRNTRSPPNSVTKQPVPQQPVPQQQSHLLQQPVPQQSQLPQPLIPQIVSKPSTAVQPSNCMRRHEIIGGIKIGGVELQNAYIGCNNPVRPGTEYCDTCEATFEEWYNKPAAFE